MKQERIGQIIAYAIAGIFILFLWVLGSIASYQTPGSVTLWTLLAILGLAVGGVVAGWCAYLAIVTLYNPKRMDRANFNFHRGKAVWNPRKRHVLGHAAVSYGTAVYLYAVIFVLLSKYDSSAFSPSLESLGSAAYFSIVTIATVGYGDIQPVSGVARSIASAEILSGVAYTVFLFSVVAGYLRERD